MTAPVTTARVAPVGVKLDDGFSTQIAFAADPNVSFWEKTVQPPGVDVGDAIDTSTMFNTAWRTKAARQLKELTDAAATVAYDPVVLDQIVALAGVEGSVTVHFPNDDTWAFFGYLKSFEPQDLSEGEQPEAQVTIVCTNTDPASGAEEEPVYTAASGT